jgi:hypothetical protein
MLRFELTNIKDGEVIYQYYPEGSSDDSGSVVYDTVNSSVIIANKAKADEELFNWYMHHMVAQIDSMARSDQFEKTGEVAWY